GEDFMKDRQLGLGCLGLALVLVQGCTQREPVATAAAAPAAAAMPAPAPDPLVFDTWVPGPCSPNGQPQGQCPPGDLFRVRLVPVAEGLRSPRHLAFTPDGDLLITELAMPAGEPGGGNQAVQTRTGHVRVVHDGRLVPEPLAGWPAPGIDSGALWSAVPHPQFAANRLVYLYYVKKRADGMLTRAVARARLEGASLQDVEEIFEADAAIPGGPMAGRAVFGPDGLLYLTINDHVEHDFKNGGGEPLLAQQLDNDVGKVLRVRDDGSIPPDNPFVGRKDAKPEIFTFGQRNVTDFSWHPATGELWTTEIAPMGGDEINVLHAGHNYGWPLVSLGKNYNQKEMNDNHWYRPGMDMPAMYWTPSISPSTLLWYTGDKLAPWKGHLLVGALNGQALVRVAFDQPMPQMERRDMLFMSLGRRWRHVVQSPDGYVYALTEKRTLGVPADPNDATSGVVYRIEPAQ
ncbi:MAG TPA: PQQ-dependent sugar dehydrogenase, partial [Gammaproteobacteria bacterium]|nr:PQQ-dependent sugar dehydrogenase [Gammaproteobacteria bacterium]